MLLRIFMLVTMFCSYQAFAQNAEARFVFLPSMTFHKEVGVVGGDQSSLKMDFRVAYINTTSWYFGMIYSHTKGGGAYRLSQTSIGNSIGYSFGPALFILSYYLMSKLVEDDGTGNGVLERDGGSGVQFDIVYTFPIFTKFSLAPMLSYKNLSFKRESRNGVTSSQGNNETFFYPFIGVLATW